MYLEIPEKQIDNILELAESRVKISNLSARNNELYLLVDHEIWLDVFSTIKKEKGINFEYLIK